MSEDRKYRNIGKLSKMENNIDENYQNICRKKQKYFIK